MRKRTSAPGTSSVVGSSSITARAASASGSRAAGLAPVAAVGRDRHRLGAVERRARRRGRARGSRSRRRGRSPGRGRACRASRARRRSPAPDRRAVTAPLPRWRRRGSGSGSPCPGRGCAGSRGSSTTLAKRSRQVSSRLSQPARTTKSWPAAIGRTGASSSASRRGAGDDVVAGHLGDAGRRSAPLVQVSRPRVNQPAAKPPSPEAVKLRSPVDAP